MGKKKITIENKFPSRLRLLIEEECDGKQRDFTEKTGISQSYLSMVLSGKRGPSADLIAALAIHFSKNLFWLITGEKGKAEEETAGRVDSDRLKQAITAIETVLEGKNGTLTPDKRAKLIVAVYEMPEPWDDRMLARLIDLAR